MACVRNGRDPANLQNGSSCLRRSRFRVRSSRSLSQPCRSLLLVDQRAARKSWEERYRVVLQRLGRVRERIRTFLSEERGRFRSWIGRRFPGLAREIEQAERNLHALRQLVFEVESLSWLKGHGLAFAYRKILEKHSAGRSARKAEPMRDPREESPDPGLRDAGQAEERRRRLKKAYRTLARRLHPDLNSDGDGRRIERWRAVQLAYQSGDLALLEAFCLEDDHTFIQDEPLSRLAERVSQERKTLARYLRKLRSYRKDPAWGCRKGSWESTVGPKVEGWLRARLAEMRKETRELKNRIRQWQQESERMFARGVKP